jgi:hypothetical protein
MILLKKIGTDVQVDGFEPTHRRECGVKDQLLS